MKHDWTPLQKLVLLLEVAAVVVVIGYALFKG
jgi:hypothetical protein